jgi:hypothetical protein
MWKLSKLPKTLKLQVFQMPLTEEGFGGQLFLARGMEGLEP